MIFGSDDCRVYANLNSVVGAFARRAERTTRVRLQYSGVRFSMPAILVTGGAGYVGSYTVVRLLEAGYHVVVVDNLRTGHRWAIERIRRYTHADAARFAFIHGDVADTALVVRLVREYDVQAALHFAALSLVGESFQHPEQYFAENVAKGIVFLKTLVSVGVKYVVFSSSAAIYGVPLRIPISEDTDARPVSPYGASKHMLEEVLRWLGEAYPLRSIALRYFNAAGAHPDGWLGEAHEPETHLIPLALRSVLRPGEDRVAQLLGKFAGGERCRDKSPVRLFGTDYSTPDGTCIRDYIHVSDLAAAHVVALEALFDGHPTDCWNVGTGQGYSVRQVIDAVERVTGRVVPVVEAPRRPGDPPVLVAEATKLPRLGWKPQYASLDAIVATAWYWHNASLSANV